MIVRCKNCKAVFSVDDGKVENKKFAFTCPKCSNENIIDNRAGRGFARDDRAPAHETPRYAGRPSPVAEKERDEPIAARIKGISTEAASESEFDKAPHMDVRREADLPPADDLGVDIPLDDYTDSELESQEIGDIDEKESRPITDRSATLPKAEVPGQTVFEELGDIDKLTADAALITDEMEPLSELKSATDMPHTNQDESALEDEKIIIDEFEPMEEEIDIPSSKRAERMLAEENIKTEEVFPKDHTTEDESITIDLDSLDIDLDKNAEELIKTKPAGATVAAGRSGQTVAGRHFPDEDENITIDLDTLDLDVEGEDKISGGEIREDLDLSDFSEESLKELEDAHVKQAKQADDDLTLDLDSLDISLDESSETKEGEILDENDKLTLRDADLSLDDLTIDELTTVSESIETISDNDVPVSSDRFDSSLDLHAIDKELKEAESILSESPEKTDLLIGDEFNDLPEIDLTKPASVVDLKAGREPLTIDETDDEFIGLIDNGKIPAQKGGLHGVSPDLVARGSLNFSIDYSIKYSRAGALLRLCGLYLLGMIPHYISCFIYSILSFILGFLNYIIIMFTGNNVEDFSEIQENTLRHILSIGASLIGIVDEMPVFAGRSNIDYPLQMRITYPPGYSRLLALLRISFIGIVLIIAPHLLVLGLVSLAVPIIFLVGIVSVLLTGKWPHALFEFMTRYYRYTARVLAFGIGIIDEYPPFKFN